MSCTLASLVFHLRSGCGMDAFVSVHVWAYVCVRVVYVGLSVLKGGVGWGGVKRHAHLFSFPQFYECNYSEQKSLPVRGNPS